MSKAYEMISDSLEEIIKDLEENNGKNLKRKTLLLKTLKPKQNKIEQKKSARVRLKSEVIA
jgi:hypothetical protein